MRKRVSRSSDKRRFKYTATRSKKINISPTVYRGGIRL